MPSLQVPLLCLEQGSGLAGDGAGVLCRPSRTAASSGSGRCCARARVEDVNSCLDEVELDLCGHQMFARQRGRLARVAESLAE